MSSDSFVAHRNRLVLEAEQLVLCGVSTGSLEFVPASAFAHGVLPARCNFWHRIVQNIKRLSGRSHPIETVILPSRTYLILKGIPARLQHRYGLESEEGAMFLRPDHPEITERCGLLFNNGAFVQVNELGAGQQVEVLSLAGTQLTLYEPECSDAKEDQCQYK